MDDQDVRESQSDERKEFSGPGSCLDRLERVFAIERAARAVQDGLVGLSVEDKRSLASFLRALSGQVQDGR